MRIKIICTIGFSLCITVAAYSQQKKGIMATAKQLDELMVSDSIKGNSTYVWGTAHISTPAKTGDLREAIFSWFPAIVVYTEQVRRNRLYLLMMPSK